MTKQEFERGTVWLQGGEVQAIRFASGIVHVIKSRRGVRVPRKIAQTFVPNPKESDSND